MCILAETEQQIVNKEIDKEIKKHKRNLINLLLLGAGKK